MPRALLIDDQEWTVDGLREALDTMGVENDYASTIDDALELLADEDYQVVVTDFDMDGLNGTQVLRLIRGNFGGLEIGADDVDEAAVRSFDADLGEVIADHFASFSDYCDFVARHRHLILCLFTGNAREDLDDQEALDGVLYARKGGRARSSSVEQELAAEIVEELGSGTRSDGLPRPSG